MLSRDKIEDLIDLQNKIFIAYSGGPDSTALIHIFADLMNSNKLNVEAGCNYVKKNKKLQCALTWKRKNIEFRDKTSINLKDLKDILLIDEIDFINIQYTDEDDEVKKFERENNFVLGKVNGLDPLMIFTILLVLLVNVIL